MICERSSLSPLAIAIAIKITSSATIGITRKISVIKI